MPEHVRRSEFNLKKLGHGENCHRRVGFEYFVVILMLTLHNVNIISLFMANTIGIIIFYASKFMFNVSAMA